MWRAVALPRRPLATDSACHHVVVVALGERRDEALPLLDVGRVQLDRAQLGAEALDLCHPRREHRERRHHQVGPRHPQVELEVRQEGNGLQQRVTLWVLWSQQA